MYVFLKHTTKTPRAIVFIGILLFIISACQKSDDMAVTEVPILLADSVIVVNDTIVDDPIVLDYDTVFPESYWPVYPGSYWDYIDSDGVISASSVNDEYILHSHGLYAYPTENNPISELKYVPQLDDSSIYYGYKKKVHNMSTIPAANSPFRTILKEELGGTITTFTGSQYSQSFLIETTTAVDTTVVVNGVSFYPTIEVSNYYMNLTEEMVEPRLTGMSYYTKDVGLIKRVYIVGNTDPPTIENEKTLTNYFINN